jgi:hypothetical protein
MNKEDIKILEKDGWDVVCESPLELEMWEDGELVAVAKGRAAAIILSNLKMGFYL